MPDCASRSVSVIDAVDEAHGISRSVFPHAVYCAFEMKTTHDGASAPESGAIMADDNKLVAEARDKFGKGAARKIRAAGKIPAVIYGHGTDPQHVTLPAHQVGLILRKANAVLELDIAGKTQLALVKDVQKDPVHQIIEHLDLIIVRKGEKVTIDV